MKFRKTNSGSYYWNSRNKTYTINAAARHTAQGNRIKWILWVKVGKAIPNVVGLFDTADLARSAAIDHHNSAIAPLSS